MAAPDPHPSPQPTGRPSAKPASELPQRQRRYGPEWPAEVMTDPAVLERVLHKLRVLDHETEGP